MTLEERVRKTFDLFDEDHDGFISSSDLRKAMKKFKIDSTESEIENVIKAADYDGDGKVSYDEFVAMMSDDD